MLIDLSAQSSGIYFVRILDGNKINEKNIYTIKWIGSKNFGT
jgi:hypothetical protein